jgi:Ca-activated chloride channel family protein
VRRARAVAWAAACAALAACGGRKEAAPAATLTVLAGSEVKDLEPYLDEIRHATGVTLQLQYSGTLAGVERLLGGEPFDAAWFSHGKYLMLADTGHNRVKAAERIMLSPVVLGVRAGKARAFGWVDNPNVTWAEVAARVRSGEFRYAMTNPTASNSGFSAVIGVAAALSHSANALTAGQMDVRALHDFFQGQRLTAGSSGWLAEAYVRDQDRLDGIINYESVLLTLNRGGQLKEPLVLVYPREGIVTADYPLVLLNGAKRAQYDTVVAFLRSAAFQRTIMTRTFRRPVNPDVALDSTFPRSLIVELPFPTDLAVVDRILDSYLADQRRPAHAFFLLDVSGSMRGPRLADLQSALVALAGDDPSLTGRFAKFQPREVVTITTFSDLIQDQREFALGSAAQAPAVRDSIKAYVQGLRAGGGTAMFSSLETVYQNALAARARDAERYLSIVLMTDGQSNQGIDLDGFRAFYASLPPGQRDVKVFAIQFGEADRSQLEGVTALTGGRLFPGTAGRLSTVFKEIRGYQ